MFKINKKKNASRPRKGFIFYKTRTRKCRVFITPRIQHRVVFGRINRRLFRFCSLDFNSSLIHVWLGQWSRTVCTGWLIHSGQLQKEFAKSPTRPNGKFDFEIDPVNTGVIKKQFRKTKFNIIVALQ